MAAADGGHSGRRRPGRALVALLTVCLAAAAALTALAAGAPRSWTPVTPIDDAHVTATIRYSRGFGLDVYTPNGPHRTGLPVVVMLHGCCGNRADLASLAEATAAHGALVFNADWPGIRSGAYPVAYQVAACAVRVARALATRFGGDPARLALLGWSDGAMIAAVVAEDGDRFHGACPVSRGSARPSVLVGVAGFFGWPLDEHNQVLAGPVSNRATAFFGGPPAQVAAAWAGGDPYAVVGRNPRLRTVLVVGATDPMIVVERAFAARLRRAHQPVSLVAVPDEGDQSMIAPRTGEGRATVEQTLAALRTRSR